MTITADAWPVELESEWYQGDQVDAFDVETEATIWTLPSDILAAQAAWAPPLPPVPESWSLSDDLVSIPLPVESRPSASQRAVFSADATPIQLAPLTRVHTPNTTIDASLWASSRSVSSFFAVWPPAVACASSADAAVPAPGAHESLPTIPEDTPPSPQPAPVCARECVLSTPATADAAALSSAWTLGKTDDAQTASSYVLPRRLIPTRASSFPHCESSDTIPPTLDRMPATRRTRSAPPPAPVPAPALAPAPIPTPQAILKRIHLTPPSTLTPALLAAFANDLAHALVTHGAPAWTPLGLRVLRVFGGALRIAGLDDRLLHAILATAEQSAREELAGRRTTRALASPVFDAAGDPVPPPSPSVRCAPPSALVIRTAPVIAPALSPMDAQSPASTAPSSALPTPTVPTFALPLPPAPAPTAPALPIHGDSARLLSAFLLASQERELPAEWTAFASQLRAEHATLAAAGADTKMPARVLECAGEIGGVIVAPEEGGGERKRKRGEGEGRRVKVIRVE
jgi:hypothetical protein